jgi:hypothetical protein
MKLKDAEGTSIHYQGKNLAAYIRERDTTPFVWDR